MTDRAFWRIQTERFLQYAFLVHILFGVAVRLRIQFASAFPTLQPGLWHLVGLAEDAAVGSVAAVLALLLARSERSAAMGRALFALAVVLNSFIHRANWSASGIWRASMCGSTPGWFAPAAPASLPTRLRVGNEGLRC